MVDVGDNYQMTKAPASQTLFWGGYNLSLPKCIVERSKCSVKAFEIKLAGWHSLNDCHTLTLLGVISVLIVTDQNNTPG